MSTVGIVAEFNPLHNGHKLLLQKAKKYGKVVCVISGNFVQRGDTAIVEKGVRAKMALECGADLVVELPVCYSMSTAQNFALGAVSILDALGCDILMFGSEAGRTCALKKASGILSSQEFSEKLPENLKGGVTFAKARQITAEQLGVTKGLLEGANNNLAIEYITACRNIGSKMQFKTVKRQGAMHDSRETDHDFVSASLIREKLLKSDFEFVKKYIPEEIGYIFKEDFSDIKRIENTVLGVLRTKTSHELSHLPDLSEGVENKLFSAVKSATSLSGLYEEIKVKRYTLARVRRLVLSAFLGIDNTMFMKTPPYLRILGFNKKGEKIIKENKHISKIPFVLRANEIENLGDDAKKVFALECKATDLYALSFEKPLECGIEYTRNLIKLKEANK